MCSVCLQLGILQNFGAGSNQTIFLSSQTDHFSTTSGDKGWGCGYRNLQMFWSSLIKIHIYQTPLSTGSIRLIIGENKPSKLVIPLKLYISYHFLFVYLLHSLQKCSFDSQDPTFNRRGLGKR